MNARAASIETAWSATLGLRAPVLNAPMGGVAGGALAAAVSAAGGFGMIGIGSAGSVELVRREVGIATAAGQRFGIGLLDWKLAADLRLLDAAIDAGPALLSVSFGEAWPWTERVRAAGITTAVQVADVATARRAADAGVEVIVARGAEGGGHGDPAMGTLPLLEGVLDAVDVPVLAAGGITSARGLAAVLAAGASGAWLGTAFATCPESLATDGTRQALLDAVGTATVTTRAFDVGLGYAWPDRYPERVLANSFTERWSGRERELEVEIRSRRALTEAVAADDRQIAQVDGGQGVGLVTQIRSAGSVIDDLCQGAIALLSSWHHLHRTDAPGE